ncbi:MAG: hypothetical protein F4X26_11360 [Chloroflexi bacterium]|nr:hypothetical protein [Chloroflexota bacterium]
MHQALLVGLPSSGKTTFLAALWHVIFVRDVDGALELEVLHAPFDHLNDLTGRWLRFEVANRTSIDAEQTATIRIKPGDGESTTEIVVPDLAGESIKRSLADRQWPTGFRDYVHDSTGVLLFVHPKETSEPWPILDAMEIAGEEALPSQESGAADASTESEWSAEQVPTDVQLVDLLQLLCTEIATGHFRLAVIVSAWDLVEEQGTPSEWLAKELPLVDQFLRSHDHSRFDVRVYGVSAQGGELPQESDRLKSLLSASERIRVVRDANAESHDITEPLRWVVDVDTG